MSEREDAVVERVAAKRYEDMWACFNRAERESAYGGVRETLAAIRECGLVVVPVEPTEAMIEAAMDWEPLLEDSKNVAAIYRAMIRAASEGRT